MAQHGTFQVSEVADRAAAPAATDGNIPHPDAANRQQTANNPSIVDTLLQAPALAPGDKVEDFRALVAEVSAAVQPHTLFERLEVNDLCHALWEEQRFRRQQAALPVATGLKALACLLASNGFEKDALDIATGYFCEGGEERTRATALLRRFNITDDAINAQASQHNLPILSMLERLMASRQSRRDVILSEYHRRQRKADKSADKSTSRKSAAEPLSDRPVLARH
jgi:hypothetical protein